MKKEKVRFYVEKQSKLVQSAVVLMILSAVFRIIGCWKGFSDSFYAITQIALPLSCNLLFILVLLIAGKRFFSLTSVPVVLGAVFLVFKVIGCANWLHMALFILICVVLAAAYCATVYGVIPTKWVMLPVLLLPFVYQIFVSDAAKFSDSAAPLTFAVGMQEMSVLCIVLALFSTLFAMKKKKPAPIEEQNLPKMKDPKPIMPEAAPAQEQAEQPQEQTVIEEIK